MLRNVGTWNLASNFGASSIHCASGFNCPLSLCSVRRKDPTPVSMKACPDGLARKPRLSAVAVTLIASCFTTEQGISPRFLCCELVLAGLHVVIFRSEGTDLR